jgi:uncharacterized repeat protein (TIGR01451 family)
MNRATGHLLLAASILLTVLLVTFSQSAALASPPQGADPSPGPASEALSPQLAGRVEPRLLKQVLRASPDREYRFIVELKEQADLSALRGRAASPEQVVNALQASAAQSQAGILSFLKTESAAGRVAELHPFWILNGVAVRGKATTLLALAARPEVAIIREDSWRQWVDSSFEPAALSTESNALAWNVSRIGADRAWNTLAISGTGVTVGIMDTGVDWQHPALQAQYRGYKPDGLTVHVGNWYCTTTEGALYPVDGHGHGTHVTGTAVGRAVGDAPAIGVAPGAQWIAVKTLNDAGWGYDSWIHAAFEWLLAPAGDPALAPDVVNGSWGNDNGASEVLRPDVQALRAAGIVPVFAAGNAGPDPGTVRSPGSLPEAIAVGASGDLDQVLDFSSRGPSAWGEIKPEVVAPGVNVLSSLPGGAYATAYGTSMAAPHVSGLAALLLQADAGLSVDAVEALITGTSLPLGDIMPNNDSGWGRIDAYQAAATALHAGSIVGKVRNAAGRLPIANAQISVYDEQDQRRAVVQTDAGGLYSVALPAGVYRVTAEAFAFAGQTQSDVAVEFGATTTANFLLERLPLGTLEGKVRDAETNEPLSVQVLVQGTPASTWSSAETGSYRLDLPTGIYALEARLNGYRRLVADGLAVMAGQTTQRDLVLTSAPTLLLVDSGWWYYDSHGQTLAQALEDSNYVHDLWEVRAYSDAPALDDLLPYEAVVWSSPLDSPELIGAGDTISNYLGTGGNLLLTGQDVGYWESGTSGFIWHEYYGHLLQAEFVSDDAGQEDVIGTPGSTLAGLILPLNDPDSDRNQVTPDSIRALDGRVASLAGQYAGGAGAALQAEACQSYRAVYLAAGLEGLGDRVGRAAVVERSLEWLGSPALATGVDLFPDDQEKIWLEGPYLTHLVTARNIGQAAGRFSLELSPSSWAASLWDSSFETQIAESPVLEPCEWFTIGVKVEVPADAPWNTTDTVTLTARSLADPLAMDQATLRSKTPAPILLVDDHRWYDVSGAFHQALESNRLPYDFWEVQLPAGAVGSNLPSLEQLQHYPLVLWFTGFDWYSTLTAVEEALLAGYLDGGGRLVLSSQDYLNTRGLVPFGQDYLGVAGAQQELTATIVLGAVDSPVGAAMPAVPLAYPYDNWSDALRATAEAQPAFWGQHGQPAALNLALGPFKSAFFAFSLEALPGSDMAEVLGRTVGWLSPLGDSSLRVERHVVGQSQELSYTLQIRNTGPALLAAASLSNTLPVSTSYVSGSLEGPGIYDPASRQVSWQGTLAPGQTVEIGYRVLVEGFLPEGTMIRNRARLADESGLWFERVASTRVAGPDLSASTLIVEPAVPRTGQAVTFSFTLRNEGLRGAPARLVAPFPPGAGYEPGSAQASSGMISATEAVLVWSGSIEPGSTVTVTLPLTALPSAAARYLLLRSSLEDGSGGVETLEAYAWVKAVAFLPVLVKEE